MFLGPDTEEGRQRSSDVLPSPVSAPEVIGQMLGYGASLLKRERRGLRRCPREPARAGAN